LGSLFISEPFREKCGFIEKGQEIEGGKSKGSEQDRPRGDVETKKLQALKISRQTMEGEREKCVCVRERKEQDG
jgi:hypothetical protein